MKDPKKESDAKWQDFGKEAGMFGAISIVIIVLVWLTIGGFVEMIFAKAEPGTTVPVVPEAIRYVQFAALILAIVIANFIKVRNLWLEQRDTIRELTLQAGHGGKFGIASGGAQGAIAGFGICLLVFITSTALTMFYVTIFMMMVFAGVAGLMVLAL